MKEFIGREQISSVFGCDLFRSVATKKVIKIFSLGGYSQN